MPPRAAPDAALTPAPARPTIRDVAREAGVSYQTVSRAINDATGIDPGTKRRVLEVAEALGYRPSRLARSLVTRRTDTIGLAVNDLTNPFFSHVAQAVLQSARSIGHQTMVLPTPWDAQGEEAALEAMISHSVDGIIAFVDNVSDVRLQAIADRLPLVLVNRWSHPSGIPTLTVDLVGGTRQAIEHLVELGHRRIGMVDGTPAWNAGDSRHTTFLAVVTEHGLGLDESFVVRDAPSADGGRRASQRLLAAHPDVTAIFAFNDVMAAGALDALRLAGRHVPRDCAVIGFDGVQLCELMQPPLSTVALDFAEFGQRATAIIGRWLAQGRDAALPLAGDLPTRLVVRESTVGATVLD
jgi:LacI family transcriptional regulator